MKKQNIYIAVLIIGVLLFAASCQSSADSSSDNGSKSDKSSSDGSSDYSSTADKFSIAFPEGSGGVKTKTESVKYAKSATSHGKFFDNRSKNYRNYEVQVLDMESSTVEGKSPREILEIALNGWEKEPETQIKDITVDGKKGIDSVRTVEIGPMSMTFREVVFWSEAEKKLYVVKVSASQKENTTTPEADKFVNSFKLKA